MSNARRSPSAPKKFTAAPRSPEHKIGPFPGGISVAIWLNTSETDEGPRKFRSLTVSPRRYLDRDSGEWRDSTSYHPGDIPALVFALQKAQEYILTVPLPGQETESGDRPPF